MDIKQLQALADKMGALKTDDDDDRFNEGVDAAVNILYRAIKQIETQEKIIRLQQQIEELQTQLTQEKDEPLATVTVKPKGRRGRKPKNATTEVTS